MLVPGVSFSESDSVSGGAQTEMRIKQNESSSTFTEEQSV